ncbi:MAG: ATP synthase F1 subunit epsilon [Prevotella sp.]|jgi:F-type H+-transporting ATPase subunit epsilon|nr:ATP synthase F1 subunit epsilon [Prevotella sp.]
MKAPDFELKIISAEKTLFGGKITTVTLPGTQGSFSVLPDHAPLVSSLSAGVIEYNDGTQAATIEINGGFVDVNRNVVTICVE